MVRAGVVGHPSEWPWCSYPELSGTRRRYRIVDHKTFKNSFGQAPQEQDFIDFYSNFVQEGIKAGLEREPAWSESLAVGSKEFVKEISWEIRNRIRFDISNSSQAGERWVLKENGPLYS
jgi:putative transposase